MLNLIRQHSDSWLIKTILWTIIFAFVGTIFYSWGMGGATSGRGGVVATVEGVAINYSEYDRSFNNLVNFYREQFRNQFSEDMIRKLDLKTQALEALIQKKLLLMEAEKQNIRVSDTELANHIKSFPAFQKDKKFEPSYYKNYLKRQRLSSLEFEEGLRESQVIKKIENLITGNTMVSEAEVQEAFKLEEESIKLEYLRFSEDHFKSSEPITEQDLNDYYEKNKLQFEVPEQIRVEYIKVTSKDFEKGIEVREEDIQDYYEAKIADFQVKKQYKASHILFQLKPPENGENLSQEERQKSSEEAAKSKADDALKTIREGASFPEIAKKLSEDTTSGRNGGSLGEFASGAMVPQFESALDKLKVGEISEPVLTPFGYHIIRLEGKQEERIKPLEEVRDTVVRALEKIKGRQRARRAVKRIYKSAQSDGDLARAALEHKMETKTTGLFSRKEHNLPEIGTVPEFFNLAFSLSGNEVSNPLNTPEASYILKIPGRTPPYIPEMKDVQDKIKKEVTQIKNKAYSRQMFQGLETRLEQDNDLMQIAEEHKMGVRRTPFFSMPDSIPGIGNIQDIKEKAFNLEIGQSTTASVRNYFYLLKVTDREKAGDPEKEQIEEITKRLRAQKGNNDFQEWLKNLRENADIMIDKTLL